ncbi:GNAT family N-acetyltransferase [Angustibacter speluncae]
MTIEVLPATHARFDDLATVLGPRRPESSVCWCLSYRIPSKENRELTGVARRDRVEALTRKRTPPGVLAYDEGEVVGWCGVAPRADLHSFATSRRIPHVDDLPVWTIWCFRVRGGLRGKGIATALLDGAIAHARERGAPAVEGYPVDNDGRKVDLTMAYVGTRGMFEKAGFTKAADTQSVLDGFPRVLMRLDLR